jgi:ubiquinone/menaquinone biosynthesis C-methylase UbiE
VTDLPAPKTQEATVKITGVLWACIVIGLAGCAGLDRIDYPKVPTRAAWQHPNQVIESLGIDAGDVVADIGAGDGYFTFRMAEAVGPEGRVYAVEVDEELTAELEREARGRGDDNVVVVRGAFADPLLPDGAIDLVFLCNTYHHIDDRSVYFSALRTDLAPSGRVAVIDMKDDLTGILRLFATKDHWTPMALLDDEMKEAGYRKVESFDYLPTQNFVVFSPQ